MENLDSGDTVSASEELGRDRVEGDDVAAGVHGGEDQDVEGGTGGEDRCQEEKEEERHGEVGEHPTTRRVI